MILPTYINALVLGLLGIALIGIVGSLLDSAKKKRKQQIRFYRMHDYRRFK